MRSKSRCDLRSSRRRLLKHQELRIYSAWVPMVLFVAVVAPAAAVYDLFSTK